MYVRISSVLPVDSLDERDSTAHSPAPSSSRFLSPSGARSSSRSPSPVRYYSGYAASAQPASSSPQRSSSSERVKGVPFSSPRRTSPSHSITSKMSSAYVPSTAIIPEPMLSYRPSRYLQSQRLSTNDASFLICCTLSSPLCYQPYSFH